MFHSFRINKQYAKTLVLSFLLSILLLVPLICITQNDGPYSYALYDKNGTLIGASVAPDGQWRFAPGKVPKNFADALITFEDRRFYYHQGIDILSLYRAIFLDIRAHRIVSGGSTITMQTVRILEHKKKRTIAQKCKETFLAVLYEIRYTKKDILETYSANAPFGGNVVGLEAASWRYFNRPPESLSWAEAATLAVLPNQPSLVYPGANKKILQTKRDRLLHRLYEKGSFNDEILSLSLAEPLPEKPYVLPSLAPHYFEFVKSTHPKKMKLYTNLDAALEKNCTQILEKWSSKFARSGINNGAAIVIDTQNGNILAYCGNTGYTMRNVKNGSVDIVQSRRSSGSLLKPFLYAAMLDSGMILPDQLVIDIPTRIGSYKPDNNIPIYRGVVPASEALSRSLNIPAIRELQQYGITAFLDYLRKCGFTTFDRTPDEYGLPLILGGGEITLYEGVKAYSSMMNKACGNGDYPSSQGSAYLTLEALEKGIRPDDEALWENYANSKKIAWKTGTSSGNRDAWAIGTTKEYTVGVWIGNAEGQGSPELKSISTAAPVLFDIFSVLPKTSWPDIPYDNLSYEIVCTNSGYIAGENCTKMKQILSPRAAPKSEVCPFCTKVSFTPDGKYQATVQDLTGKYAGKMPLIKKCFVLPPVIEYWYKKHAIDYHQLPPFLPGSLSASAGELAIVFPEQGANICIPVEIDGNPGAMVMKAVDRDSKAVLYWDIDGEFIGTTEKMHEISVHPSAGKHILTVTDTQGRRKVRTFEIIGED